MTPVFWKPRRDDEVNSELAFHVEMRTRELIARGATPAAARRDAFDRFGNYHKVSATCKHIASQRDRQMRRTEYLSELRHDVIYALRQVGRNKALTVVAVLTLALGIGSTTAIFSAVRAVVLRPFAYENPDRVMLVGETWGQNPLADVSVGNYVDWHAASRGFDHLSAANYGSFTLQDGTTPDRVFGAYVTWNFFPTFGARTLIGRTFHADEDQPGKDNVVVLSEALWRDRFAGDSSVVGREIRVNGRMSTVVGVLPESFDPALAEELLWVPIAFTPERKQMHDEHYLTVFGLLKRDADPAQVQRELDAIAKVGQERFPNDNAGRGIAMRSLADFNVGPFRQRLYVMLGAVSFVLLIACGNVANLLLARGAARGKELAIRTAIGAGKGRLVRQLLTESVVLSLIGAAGGVALAWGLVQVLVAAAPPGIPRIGETRIDAWVLLFALAVAMVSAVACGLVPALRAGKQDLQSFLKEGGRTSGSGARDVVRSAFIVAEVALSLTLLVGAGLLIRSAINLQRTDAGFNVNGLLTARVALPPGAYLDGGDHTARTFETMLERIRQSPNVASASLTSQAPMGAGGNSNGLLPEGKAIEAANFIEARLRMITPGYFETMGIQVLKGRGITSEDVRGSQLVMVVSEALAQAAWPNEDAIGKRISCCEGTPTDPRWKTVIGVVRDVRSAGPTQAARPEFYVPIQQVPPAAWDWVRRSMTVVARARTGDVAALTPSIREAVRQVDPSVPVFGARTMNDALRGTFATPRFNTMLLGLLAIVGLLLSSIGIYSVIAYFVSLRTHEIGVRMALGATTRDVLRLLTFQGLRPVLIGIVFGAIGAFWATRLLAGSLFGIEADDPMTFAAVAGLMLAVSACATLIPARRAMRVEPSSALLG